MLSDIDLGYVLRSWDSIGKTKVNNAPETQSAQPQKTSQNERGKDPYLVFKNVPPTINIEILIELCSGFGKVLRGRQHEQFNMFFVNFATMNDLLNVLEGLKCHSLGFTIELGKTFINQTGAAIPNSPVENQGDIKRIPQRPVVSNDIHHISKDKSHDSERLLIHNLSI